MGDSFSLIKKLGELEKNPEKGASLPSGIKYQTHTLLVDGEDIEVFIPLREAAAFEQTLSEYGKYLNRESFCAILRKHRGVRNWE